MKTGKAIAAAVAALVALPAGAWAESTTVYAQMVAVPTGPATNCHFKLYVSPSPSSIASWATRVWYDNTKVAMQGTGYTNISGETGLVGQAGPETADTSSHPGITNVYRNYVFDSMPSLFSPTDLVQLNFVTTAGYTGPANTVLFFIAPQPFSQMIDDNLVDIDETYPNANTPLYGDGGSTVADWELY